MFSNEKKKEITIYPSSGIYIYFWVIESQGFLFSGTCISVLSNLEMSLEQTTDHEVVGAYQTHYKENLLYMCCFYECDRCLRYGGYINLELYSEGSA